MICKSTSIYREAASLKDERRSPKFENSFNVDIKKVRIICSGTHMVDCLLMFTCKSVKMIPHLQRESHIGSFDKNIS